MICNIHSEQERLSIQSFWYAYNAENLSMWSFMCISFPFYVLCSEFRADGNESLESTGLDSVEM